MNTSKNSNKSKFAKFAISTENAAKISGGDTTHFPRLDGKIIFLKRDSDATLKEIIFH